MRVQRALAVSFVEGHITASLRWLVLRLDGPGAELLWKVFRAFKTLSSLKSTPMLEEQVKGVEVPGDVLSASPSLQMKLCQLGPRRSRLEWPSDIDHLPPRVSPDVHWPS